MRLAVITSGRIKMYGLQAPVLLAQPFKGNLLSSQVGVSLEVYSGQDTV